MKSIWKYPFYVKDAQLVELPKGAKILSVGVQNERPVLWALVDTEEKKKELRTIYIRGTGHPANDVAGAVFLGTVFMVGGAIVFHIFAEEER